MNKIFKNKKIDYEDYIIFIICILIFCLGFLVKSEFYAYLFGLIFFFTGIFAGLKERGIGLVFLVSHGLTGLMFMIMHLFDVNSIKYISNKNELFLISNFEVPTNTKIYLLLICVTFLIAIIYTVIYNLNKKINNDKNHIIRILVFYLAGLILCYLFPKLFTYLYR